MQYWSCSWSQYNAKNTICCQFLVSHALFLNLPSYSPQIILHPSPLRPSTWLSLRTRFIPSQSGRGSKARRRKRKQQRYDSEWKQGVRRWWKQQKYWLSFGHLTWVSDSAIGYQRLDETLMSGVWFGMIMCGLWMIIIDQLCNAFSPQRRRGTTEVSLRLWHNWYELCRS